MAANDAYRFKEGYRYADFSTGDKIAAVGLGSLAISMMKGSTPRTAAKAFGAGLIAVALVFLKKAWFLIFVPFIFALKWLKGVFRKT